MPLYTYQCECGHRFEQYCTMKQHQSCRMCPQCHRPAGQVIMVPILVKAAPDVCYDSPVTGEPITNWHQRKEDLKRHGCTPYDPEVKTDYANRIKREDAELDQSIEAHVEEAVEKMPTKKRAQLYSELTEQGKDIEVVRTTPHA